MLPRRPIRIAAAVAAVVGGMVWTCSSASAIGYYNLPGSFCQCFGYGNGAGYHSCLVLGPSSCEGACTSHEVRVPCPPQPPYAWYRSSSCGRFDSDPTIDESSTLPAPSPQRAPEPAAMRPQLLR